MSRRRATLYFTTLILLPLKCLRRRLLGFEYDNQCDSGAKARPVSQGVYQRILYAYVGSCECEERLDQDSKCGSSLY
jgi:hypothetical protein